MEQNRLKELILSIRKSKHNMINKASNFAEAVQAKGTVDMDTHELASLVKDAFTKRRAKVFYAETLSGVIGESASPAQEEPVVQAPTLKSVVSAGGVFTISTYTLGDPVQVDLEDQGAPIDPYLLFFTEEEADKINISFETNSASESVVGMQEVFTLTDIPNDEQFAQIKGNCTKMLYVYMLGVSREQLQLAQGEYLKVTITYDGVDYVYQI